MKNEPQQIGTATILLNEKGKVLLGKRKNGFKEGYYGLPGGRIDRGEKLKEGAKRELKEETNLIANHIEYLSVVKEWQKDEEQDFIHFIFLCDNWSGDLSLLELDKCEGWEWFDLDNLPDKILPGHLAGIKTLKDKSVIKDI